ncbi:hypothetical protein H257_17052 [Aphanomyces astaci]|uniref:Uncharacterized protein n=1 Tax=Aphanomyces astaci TaxID=112090 RepID=W4FI12_APHAT|nr:hypothetical protein H257_17052 [Aphanomyces astaci]ETV66466.1 hypothetical protein H257_17052 [Aphanomyces astaci]|eukprot:XP_009843995.1 hypothetical protein H257_17052 [Aphanomyces astaci]
MTAVMTDRITTTAATRTTRSLDVEAVVEAAAVPGLLRVKMTAAVAHTRLPIQMTAAKCKLETPDGVHHHH